MLLFRGDVSDSDPPNPGPSGSAIIQEPAAICSHMQPYAAVTGQAILRAPIFPALMAAAERVGVFVIEYARSPWNFRDALLQDPVLAACREELMVAGEPVSLGFEAKLYVRNEHAPLVVEHLRVYGAEFGDGRHLCLHELKPRHVVCAEEFKGFVDVALEHRAGTGQNGGRGKDNVRARRTMRFEVRAPPGLSLIRPSCWQSGMQIRFASCAEGRPSQRSAKYCLGAQRR